MKRLITSCFAFFLFTGVFAQTISIQGVLRDPNGRSVDDGAYSVVFRIYDTDTGGGALWTDTYTSLETKHGVFQANLGEQTSLDGLGFDTQYYVGVTVENFDEIAPRIPLTIYPYSKAILGQENKFPSVGNVEIGRDSLIIQQGALRLMGPDGVIMFNDGTTLNTAEFGGPAASLLNPTSIGINADKDTLATGNINFQIAGQTKAQLNNSGKFGIGVLNPSHYLQVSSPEFFVSRFTGSDPNGASIELHHTNGSNWELTANNTGSLYLFDQTSSANRFLINSAGDVHIGGTTNVGALNSSGLVSSSGLTAGTADTALGSLLLHGGGAAAEGGEIQIFAGSDFDDLNDFWYVDSFEDDFRIGGVGFGDAIRINHLANVGIRIPDPQAPLHVNGGANLTLAGGGSTIFGDIAGFNLSMSSIEIQARNNGAASTLLLNEEGGDVVIGSDGAAIRLAIGGNDNGASVVEINGAGAGNVEGGEIRVFKAADYDDNGDYWFMDAYEDDLRIGRIGGDFNQIVATEEGNVGVGTGTPIGAKLVVSGTGGLWSRNNFFHTVEPEAYLPNFGERHVGGVQNTDDLSIRTTHGILTPYIHIDSDARIKRVLGISNGDQDLNTLSDLEIVDYKLIDSISNQKTQYKKVIAQQVSEVYPIAVSKVQEYIPNVFQLSENIESNGKLLQISLKSSHDLAVGDDVKFISHENEFTAIIEEIPDDKTFIFKAEQEYDELFVYGKLVNDFHTVDYDAISMLNVSATQELIKRMEKQNDRIARIETENAELKAKLDKVDMLEAKLNALMGLQQKKAIKGDKIVKE